jgi:hypothetical protein
VVLSDDDDTFARENNDVRKDPTPNPKFLRLLDKEELENILVAWTRRVFIPLALDENSIFQKIYSKITKLHEEKFDPHTFCTYDFPKEDQGCKWVCYWLLQWEHMVIVINNFYINIHFIAFSVCTYYMYCTYIIYIHTFVVNCLV